MSIFFIAEIGINHNGDLSIVKDLIDVAVGAGCDAVKFQTKCFEIKSALYPLFQYRLWQIQGRNKIIDFSFL